MRQVGTDAAGATWVTGDPAVLVVFTRDLRVADNPALSAAWRSPEVVCAFVHDDTLMALRPMNPMRVRFLGECLADLDGSLRRLGSRLEERSGDWVAEVCRMVAETGARSVHVSDDVTGYARRRLARVELALGRVAELRRYPGLTVVAPGTVTPAGGDHYRVFTPFYKRWLAAPRRQLLDAPWARADTGGAGRMPQEASPAGPWARGGETAASERLAVWAAGAISAYGRQRLDLEEPSTSGLSQDLHFGCLSPLQVEAAVTGLAGAEAFVRQLCWRDFYMQILAADPAAAWSDLVTPAEAPRRDLAALAAWRSGLTGVPIVDAAMRQLALEGRLTNRARMITASFLTRNLGLDWRDGARHFLETLVDADVALNNLNWQWVAGSGTGGNPQRVLSPTRQARLFDPQGNYIRRYVTELSGQAAATTHEPWRLGSRGLARIGYPPPVVPMQAGGGGGLGGGPAGGGRGGGGIVGGAPRLLARW